MSQTERPGSSPKGHVPDGLAKGILGFVLGAGVSFLGMHFYGPREYIRVPLSTEQPPGENAVLTMPGSTPGGNAAGPPAGGGGPGGGPAAGAGKRNLTALVGKLELLSRNDLRLHVDFAPEQAGKIAAELAELAAAPTLTADEAQSRLEALETSLTPEQKQIVDSIGMPFNRPAAGGMQAPAPDENPFSQETNEKRLKELLDRLKPVAGGNATTEN